MTDKKLELTLETAAIARAVAAATGIEASSIAPNLRIRESHKPTPPAADACPRVSHGGPLFYTDFVNGLRPVEGAKLWGLRLGLSQTTTYGLPSKWTIVIRRAGTRLCEIDYDKEAACQEEIGMLRAAIDLLLTSEMEWNFPTAATAVRNYNSDNGALL
jgi:hypothetical protein